MNWDALGAIGEVVGAIAVLLTLVYLARQIKHSSDVAKVTSYHQAIDQIVQSAMDPDFAALMTKASAGDALTSEEQMRASALATCFIYGHEILLHLYSQHQVDEQLWTNIFENNLVLLQSTMMFKALNERPGPISKDLAKLVAARMT